jgi:hypothetical protein
LGTPQEHGDTGKIEPLDIWKRLAKFPLSLLKRTFDSKGLRFFARLFLEKETKFCIGAFARG